MHPEGCIRKRIYIEIFRRGQVFLQVFIVHKINTPRQKAWQPRSLSPRRRPTLMRRRVQRPQPPQPFDVRFLMANRVRRLVATSAFTQLRLGHIYDLSRATTQPARIFCSIEKTKEGQTEASDIYGGAYPG